MVASGALSNLAGAGIPNLDGSSDDPTDPNGLNAKVLVSLIGFQISAVKCTTSDINGNTQSASTAGLGGALSCTGASTINLKISLTVIKLVIHLFFPSPSFPVALNRNVLLL